MTRRKKVETIEVGNATIELHRSFSPSSVWNVGEGLFGYESRHIVEPTWVYTGFLLVKIEGDYKTFAAIEGPTWKSVCDAVRHLGFTKPTLTAKQVRKEVA